MNSSARISRASATALVALLAFSGCAPQTPDPAPSKTGIPSPEPTASPTPAPEPTRVPTPEPTQEPAALPECEGIVSTARIDEMYSSEGRLQALHDVPGIHDYVLEHEFGPVALATLDGARELRECAWGLPDSDAVIHVFVARLDDAARAKLTTALDDSIFTREEDRGTTVYTDFSSVGVAPTYKTYLFSGDLWIAELSSLTQGAVAHEALQELAP